MKKQAKISEMTQKLANIAFNMSILALFVAIWLTKWGFAAKLAISGGFIASISILVIMGSKK